MTPAPASSRDASAASVYDRPTGYAWVVVGLLFVTAALNYLDRLMITTMRDPIRADIAMSDAQFGLLTSVFLWVYAVVSPVGGYLADRCGRRRVIIASLTFWSVATVATAFAHTFGTLLAARGLMGVSEACYIPAALALVSDYHRGRTRSLATGLHMVGIYLGAALGGLGGVFAERFGWHFGFKLFGAIGIGYGLVLLFALWDAPRVDDRVPGADGGADLRPSFAQALGALFQRPAFHMLLVINVLIGVVNWAIYGWLPTFLKEQFHLGLGAAGMSATGYIQVASFGGVLVAGAVADWLTRRWPGSRAYVPAVGYVLAGPFLLLTASTDALPLAIVGLIVFGIGRGAVDANQMPLLRDLVPERYSATGYGLLNLVGTATGGAMVYVAGGLMDAHVPLGTIFKYCAAALVLAGAGFASLRAIGAGRRDVSQAEQGSVLQASRH